MEGNSISANIDLVVGFTVLEATPPKVVVLVEYRRGTYVTCSRGGRANSMDDVDGGLGEGLHVLMGFNVGRLVDIKRVVVVVGLVLRVVLLVVVLLVIEEVVVVG